MPYVSGLWCSPHAEIHHIIVRESEVGTFFAPVPHSHNVIHCTATTQSPYCLLSFHYYLQEITPLIPSSTFTFKFFMQTFFLSNLSLSVTTESKSERVEFRNTYSRTLFTKTKIIYYRLSKTLVY